MVTFFFFPPLGTLQQHELKASFNTAFALWDATCAPARSGKGSPSVYVLLLVSTFSKTSTIDEQFRLTSTRPDLVEIVGLPCCNETA